MGGRPAPADPEWVGGRPAPTVRHSDPDPAQDIANTVLEITTRFIGRAIGKRVQRTFENRIGPALQARSEQVMQDSLRDQAAIVARYPDLRGCLHDQVLFLLGGSRTVPLSDIRFPVTLAQADTLVDRLRAP